MTHPYHAHRHYHHMPERSSHILGRADGGSADEREDAAMIKRAMHEHDAQLHPGKHTRLRLRDGGAAEGAASPRRLDRGGRGSKGGGKHGHVIVNVMPGQGPARPVPIPIPGGAMPPRPAPVVPPAAAPGAGGPMVAPGAGAIPPSLQRPPMAGGMPPGMGGAPMMRKDGGRTIDGVKMIAGSRSAEGRLEKARMAIHSARAAGD